MIYFASTSTDKRENWALRKARFSNVWMEFACSRPKQFHLSRLSEKRTLNNMLLFYKHICFRLFPTLSGWGSYIFFSIFFCMIMLPYNCILYFQCIKRKAIRAKQCGVTIDNASDGYIFTWQRIRQSSWQKNGKTRQWSNTLLIGIFLRR